MIDQIDALDSGALFSPCRRWRYLLWRRWDPDKDVCAFIGLNPSTADEMTDDPTVRRCIRYAKDWGYGSLWMLNAYAFRATDPKVMKAQGANALGPRNNEYIAAATRYAKVIVAAWGAHCDSEREVDIWRLVTGAGKTLSALGWTKDGHPKHPLYLPASLTPQSWTGSNLLRVVA